MLISLVKSLTKKCKYASSIDYEDSEYIFRTKECGLVSIM